MENCDEMVPRPPNVVERYFKKRYKTDILGKVGEDQLVLTHSNKICVICIAESHAIIVEKKTVSKVSFQGEGWSRMDNTVSGKNKRGAQWLERTAPLCHVTCTDESVYALCCCLKGQLVEINTNLITNPSLLTLKPTCEGYIAVILPGLKWYEREVERLKSEEVYQAILKARQLKQQEIKSPQELVEADEAKCNNGLTDDTAKNIDNAEDLKKREIVGTGKSIDVSTHQQASEDVSICEENISSSTENNGNIAGDISNKSECTGTEKEPGSVLGVQGMDEDLSIPEKSVSSSERNGDTSRKEKLPT